MRRAGPRYRFSSIASILFVALILFVVISSGASRAKTFTTNVTTVVHDTDASGAPVLIRSDDYNGSGQATYSPSVVGSNISSGRYFLRLYSQSVRTLFITPNDPINGSQPMAPPAGYYWQNVEFAVGCSDQNGNSVPFPNILSFTGNCSMILDFGYNGIEYKLAMGPNSNLPSPAPPSGLVNVTCNLVNNGECVNWTITPNMNAISTNPPTVANLYSRTGTHQTPLVLVGQYYQTFRIDVTNP